MLKNKFFKLISISSLIGISIFPFAFFKLNTNTLSINVLNHIDNKNNLSYLFKPIDNFINVYEGSIDKRVELKYSNKYENQKSWWLEKNDIALYSNYKKSNNAFFEKFEKLDTNKTQTAKTFNSVFSDFKMANNNYSLKNNKITFDFNNNQKYSTYNYKKQCGKKHYAGMRVCGNKNHLHNRGCTKSYYVNCPGCIDATESVLWNKTYDANKMDFILRSNTIVYDEFDFGRLINIEAKNVIKSFDKSFIKIKFNTNYLNAVMMGSFNYSYATYFYNNNSWMFSNEIKNLLAAAILQNKITVFDHYIPKFCGINNQNTKPESNIRYWMENADVINEQKAKQIVDNLEVIDYGKYLLKNKININNEYLGKTLYDLFSSNKKDDFEFEIRYNIGKNIDKISKINLSDLIKNSQIYLIYNFNENPNSNDFENQKIKINSVRFITNKTNKENIEETNVGINYIDKNNNEKYIKDYSNTNFTFNNKLAMSDLFKIENHSTIENQKILIENKIFGLPSDNVNDYTFGVLTNLINYLKPIDSLITKDMSNDNYNFLNLRLKPLILNYSMIPDNKLGCLKVLINFKDGSHIEYTVDGFEKQKEIIVDQKYTDIDLSKLNLENFDLIDSEYVLNNFINYTDIQNDNHIFLVNVNKQEFKELFLNEIKINKTSETNLKIDLVINHNVDVNTKTYSFNINKVINNKPDDNKPDNNKPGNDEPNDNDSNTPGDDLDNNTSSNNQTNSSKKTNKGLTIGLTIGFIILSLSTIGISLFFLNRKKKNKKSK